MKKILPIWLLLPLSCVFAAPSALDQFPDLATFPDRTAELQQILDRKAGIPGGIYRITSPLLIQLAERKETAITPEHGGVTLIMDGPGPAIRMLGSHGGTADPKSFQPKTWLERMPIVAGIEIIGNHPEADGIELKGCFEPVISKVAVRWCRHGIHLVERNRNVVISDCHLYENAGIGLFLDDVNLHQINVANSHISYNRGGGIVVRDGNVRNLQITGCAIEANMPGTTQPTQTANILLDVSGSELDKSKSIAEIAITGCTIQHSANYGATGDATMAEGGANIRLRGKDLAPIDSVTISGNVMSDTTNLIDLDRSMDVTISGNTFFAPKPANLIVTNSQRILVNGNTFNPREFERPGTISFEKCQDCLVTNCILNDFTTKEGSIILRECDGFQIRGNTLTGCQSGIVVEKSKNSNIHDNLFQRFDENEKRISVIESVGINVRP